MAGLLAVGVALLVLVPHPDVEQIQSVAESGPWAPAGFAAVYVVATLLLLPKNVLSAAAGIAFGFGPGVVIVWLAAMIGAAAAFWLGRWLGREGVVRLAGRHMARLDGMVERHGVLAVLFARLVPVLPFTVVNYGSGVTAVRFPAYLLATAVGIVPGTVAFVSLGAFGSTPTSWQFVSAVTALAVLTVAGLLAARTRRRTRTGDL